MLTLNASADLLTSGQQRRTEEIVVPSGKFQSLISPAIKLIPQNRLEIASPKPLDPEFPSSLASLDSLIL